MKLNLFYISIGLIGLSLFVMLRPGFHSELSFYGFAESNETDINYNYPVVVEKILVTPGQSVKANDPILELSRRKSKEILEDQEYKISELRARAAIWERERMNEITQLENQLTTRRSEISLEINTKKKELEYKKGLSKDLKTIDGSASDYNPISEEIKELQTQLKSYETIQVQKIKGIKSELKIGTNPYKVEMQRLEAEREFEASQRLIPITVTAPGDGLIGNISCKEEEHIPSYTTLLTFYEPHSGIINGYVHEDLTMEVELGDTYLVSSLKDESISYPGRVIGLGSRIIEIPARLRKVPELKSYGREVQLEITRDNIFLQKEKVSISALNSGE